MQQEEFGHAPNGVGNGAAVTGRNGRARRSTSTPIPTTATTNPNGTGRKRRRENKEEEKARDVDLGARVAHVDMTDDDVVTLPTSTIPKGVEETAEYALTPTRVPSSALDRISLNPKDRIATRKSGRH
jgi:hypothetical protein